MSGPGFNVKLLIDAKLAERSQAVNGYAEHFAKDKAVGKTQPAAGLNWLVSSSAESGDSRVAASCQRRGVKATDALSAHLAATASGGWCEKG